MSGARGDGGLTTADVVDAGTSHESTVAGGGTAIVEASAVVGQEIAVDVVLEGLGRATKDETSVRSRSKPAQGIRRSIPVAAPRSMVHACEGSDVVLSSGEGATSDPDKSTNT